MKTFQLYKKISTACCFKNILRSAQVVPYDIERKIAEWLVSRLLPARKASSESRAIINPPDLKRITKSDIMHLLHYR